jgi:hypothetical protein
MPLSEDDMGWTPWETVFKQTKERSPRFFECLRIMADTHNRKNANYAGEGSDPFANFRMCEQFSCPHCGNKIPAWLGVAIRMSDKWSRFANLLGGVQDLVGESILDTDLDLGVYSQIFKVLYNEWEEDQRAKASS